MLKPQTLNITTQQPIRFRNNWAPQAVRLNCHHSKLRLQRPLTLSKFFKSPVKAVPQET